MIRIIVACAENRVIGKNGEIPWYLPEDLKHFKELTMNHTVIMGRKTFESIGKALPGRRNIVLSRSVKKIDGCEVVNSFQKALETATGEIYIIGGESLYKEALPIADVLEITEVHLKPDGDTFFPKVEPESFRLVKEEHFAGNPSYTFRT